MEVYIVTFRFFRYRPLTCNVTGIFIFNSMLGKKMITFIEFGLIFILWRFCYFDLYYYILIYIISGNTLQIFKDDIIPWCRVFNEAITSMLYRFLLVVISVFSVSHWSIIYFRHFSSYIKQYNQNTHVDFNLNLFIIRQQVMSQLNVVTRIKKIPSGRLTTQYLIN